MIKFAFLLLLAISFELPAIASGGNWQLQDVSVLYPLSAQMLTATGLLPWDVYQKNPLGSIDLHGVDQTYEALRVVSVRIDPDAHQIRMVFQPVIAGDSPGTLTTEDRAAHTFYQLRPDQFEKFFSQWTALKNQINPKPRPEPLNIHPAFRIPNLAAVFWKESKRLFSQYCNAKTLTQYTKMQLNVSDHTWWQFSGFKRAAGSSTQWHPLKIPRIQAKTEDFGNSSSKKDATTGEVIGMRGQLHFLYDNKSLELASVVDSYSDPTEAQRASFETALKFVAKFQNPHQSNPSNLDCVSCHVAQPVRFWMESSLPNLKAAGPDDFWFKNPNFKKYDLTNNTIAARSTRILRAFGYFGSEPALNKRVIHESALVADSLNH